MASSLDNFSQGPDINVSDPRHSFHTSLVDYTDESFAPDSSRSQTSGLQRGSTNSASRDFDDRGSADLQSMEVFGDLNSTTRQASSRFLEQLQVDLADGAAVLFSERIRTETGMGTTFPPELELFRADSTVEMSDNDGKIPTTVSANAEKAFESRFPIYGANWNQPPLKHQEGRTSADDPRTHWQVEGFSGSTIITDANQRHITMNVSGPRERVTSAHVHDPQGKIVGELTYKDAANSNALVYRYKNSDGDWTQVDVKEARFFQGPPPGLSMIDTAGSTTILGADGSKRILDSHGRPVEVTDADGNKFEYRWKQGVNVPEYAKITFRNGEFWELVRQPTNDEFIKDNKLLLEHDPDNISKQYKIYVNGADAPSTTSGNASVSGGGVRIGVGMPSQATCRLDHLNGDGSLGIIYPPQTIQGWWAGDHHTVQFKPDGTRTIVTPRGQTRQRKP